MTELRSTPTRDLELHAPIRLRIVAILSIVFGLIGVGFGLGPDPDIVALGLDVLLVVVGVCLFSRQPWARVAGWLLHGLAAAGGVVWTVLATSYAIGDGSAIAWLGVLVFGLSAAFSIWAFVVLRSRPVRVWFEPLRSGRRR